MNRIARSGITSFFRRIGLPEFPFHEFKQIAFACAARCGYEVSETRERGVTPNFHMAFLEGPSERLRMLGHSNFRIVAFAEPGEPYACELTFRDSPSLAKCMLEMYPEVTIASTIELAMVILESDLRQLDRAELEQVKYWKPKTIGELAFNWWD